MSGHLYRVRAVVPVQWNFCSSLDVAVRWKKKENVTDRDSEPQKRNSVCVGLNHHALRLMDFGSWKALRLLRAAERSGDRLAEGREAWAAKIEDRRCNCHEECLRNKLCRASSRLRRSHFFLK